MMKVEIDIEFTDTIKKHFLELRREMSESYNPSFEYEVIIGIYNIIKKYVHSLKIYTFIDDDKVVGILPFFILNNPCLVNYGQHIADIDHLLLGEGLPLSFSPMLNMDYIDKIIPYLPPYNSYEWVIPDINNNNIFYVDYDIIKVSNLNEYLDTIEKKYRKELKRLINKNNDLTIKITNDSITSPKYASLLRETETYRKEREASDQSDFPEWMRGYTSADLYLQGNYLILDNAKNNNALHTLEFYKGDELIGVNFSIKSGNIMSDYFSLRSMSLEHLNRSLGIYMILKNIEHSHTLNCKYYDLGTAYFTKNFNYKRKLFNGVIQIPHINKFSDLTLFNYIKNNYNIYPIVYKNKTIKNLNCALKALNKINPSRMSLIKTVAIDCGMASDVDIFSAK